MWSNEHQRGSDSNHGCEGEDSAVDASPGGTSIEEDANRKAIKDSGAIHSCRDRNVNRTGVLAKVLDQSMKLVALSDELNQIVGDARRIGTFEIRQLLAWLCAAGSAGVSRSTAIAREK